MYREQPKAMPSGPALLLLAPLAGLALNMFAQFLLGHVSVLGRLRLQFLSIALGGAAVVTMLILLKDATELSLVAWLDHAICHVLTYLCLSFCFFNVLSSTVSSLRVRMMREYLRSFPAGISGTTIRELYPSDEMLQVRLDRLLAGGQIRRHQGRYYFRRGLVHYIGKFFLLLRVILFGRAGH